MMDQGGLDVLIVEDNPTDAELALLSMKRSGITNEFLVARDGLEALDIVFGEGRFADRDMFAHPPRLILLDLKLPKVTGFEVLRRLKGDERTKNIPVVVLTSSGQEKDVARCYELGANSYVVKPVDFEKFSETVGRLWRYWLRLNEPPR